MSGFGQLGVRFAFSLGLAFSVLGAAPKKAPKPPSAGDILDRYVAVTGGASAWHSKHSERDEIEGRALEGDRVVLRATVVVSRTGDSFSEVQVPQVASEGIYKGVAWASSHFSGVRIKHGEELEEAMRDSRMLEEADWRSLYPKSRLAGVETIGNQSCYKVLLLPSPIEKVEWFSISSGLLVRRASSEISTSGETAVLYTVEQWAENQGIRQPSVMLASRGDLQYRLRILSTIYDFYRDRAAFEYPSQVAEYLAAERTGKPLPNAEELIERHIFETGGPEAYEMLRTQQITGTLTFLARNLEGRMETWSAGDGKYYKSTDIPGIGKQEEGSDGVIAWDRSPAIGPRVRPRKTRGAVDVTLDAAGVIGWRFLLDQVRTEEEEIIDGHHCYRVRLVPLDGSADMFRWYDRETGLLYRSSISTNTDMGALPVVMTFEEYRMVGDVKWPTRIRVTASGQDTVFAADEVKLNGPVDDAVFALPPEIRDLAQRKALE